ncbi:MAG TPA: DedA family protein [Chloroflexia bacterium]|nr:DedA family protein [Chloroflexia bacterium]
MDFINNVLEIVKQQYSSYGYLIVFLGAYLENTVLLGLILPGGSLVLLGAIYASQGTLSLPLVILLGWLGMFLGNSTDYWLGRLGVYHAVEKTRLHRYLKSHMDKAAAFLQKNGGISIFLSHFIGHLRSFVAITAGAVKFPYSQFARFELAAALVWNLIYCLSGYFLASSVSSIDNVILAIGLFMVGLFALGWAGNKIRQRLVERVTKREARRTAPITKAFEES